MVPLSIALLLCVQDPTVADLLKRLETGEIVERDKTEADLVARGLPALAEVQAALAKAEGGELRIRLGRVIRKLKLAEVLDRVPSQFSEGFRAAEADLLVRLKTGDPGAMIDAIAATTGRAFHWEKVDRKMSHGTEKVPREIKRDPASGATRADAAEAIRLALRAVPDPPRDERWDAVFASARSALKPTEAEDRRRLFTELLPFRTEEYLRSQLLVMAAICREPDDMPVAFAALDLREDDFTRKVAAGLLYANPGPHGPEVERRLADFKPPLRRNLLHALRATGERRYLKVFEEFIHGKDWDEVNVSLEAIRKLAPETLPGHYLKWIRSGDTAKIQAGMQPYTAPSLPSHPAPIPTPEILAEARKLFEASDSPRLRGTAFMLLKRGPAAGFRECVLQALTGGRPEVQGMALRESVDLWGDDVRKAVEKLTEAPSEMIALEASALLLRKSPPPHDLDRIRGWLKSGDPAVRKRVLSVLVASLQEKAADEVAPMLDDPDKDVRKESLRLLQGYPKAIEGKIRDKIVAMLEDPDADLRRSALEALAGNAKGLEEKIRPFLESKEPFTVLTAVRILNGLGDKAVLPYIRKGLKTHYRDDYLTCFIYRTEPTWVPILMSTIFKIPPKDATVRDVVEGLRAALKEKEIELRFELPESRLDEKFFVHGISEGGWPIGWTRTMIRESDYFFDGKTVYILTRAEAGKRWSAWVDSRWPSD